MADVAEFIISLVVFALYFNMSFRYMDKVYYVTTKCFNNKALISDIIMIVGAFVWPITCVAYYFLAKRDKKQRDLNQLIKDIIL